MMNRNLMTLSYVLFFILLSLEGGCQDVDTASVMYHNRIDEIKTAKEIKDLLMTMDTDFKRFSVNEQLKFRDPDCASLVKTVLPKSFVKTDFDGNGYTDILVIGKYYDYMVICILDSGENHFFYRVLTKRSFQDCAFPLVVKDKGNYFIDYYGYKQPDRIARDTAHTVVKKRLVYQFDDFVEYNEHVQDHRV